MPVLLKFLDSAKFWCQRNVQSHFASVVEKANSEVLEKLQIKNFLEFLFWWIVWNYDGSQNQLF